MTLGLKDSTLSRKFSLMLALSRFLLVFTTLHFFQRHEIGKDGKMLTKAALTMPRDISSGAHLNQGFRLGFMQGPGQQGRFDMPPEETADLEELEEFSKMFKQKRIKLGMYLIIINQMVECCF